MKKKLLHITTGLIIVASMILPSCDFLEACGDCELVEVDLDGNITYGTPQFVCGATYQEYINSEITYTADGSYYWNCN